MRSIIPLSMVIALLMSESGAMSISHKQGIVASSNTAIEANIVSQSNEQNTSAVDAEEGTESKVEVQADAENQTESEAQVQSES